MTEPRKRAPRKSAQQMNAEAKPSPGGARATATKAAKEADWAAAEAKAAAPQDVSGQEYDPGREWVEMRNMSPEAMTPDEWEHMNPSNVHVLWSRVMEGVRSVAKGDFNEDQGFKFRGVDAVVDAVGPALRRNGIHIRPRRILDCQTTEYTSKRGARMVNRVVRVEWEVTGPQGDSFLGESMGEAADTGDKSLTKAQSVAYRVYLLQALAIPTGDPDPDASSHERDTPAAQEGYYWDEQQRAPQSRQRGAQPQDEARQARAGEENQAAAPDNAEARKEMWRVAKGLGWEWAKLANRFKTEHGMPTEHAPVEIIEQFQKTILDEAEAEEDRAKSLVQNELGGTEVAPREPLL